jgi:PAS domain S-box-containing protein
MINIFTIILLLAACSNAVSIYIISKKKYGSTTNFWFIFLLVCTALFCLLQANISIATNNYAFIYTNKILFLIILVLPPVILNFTLSSVGKETSIGKYWYISIVSTALFILLYLLWKTDLIYINTIQKATLTQWGYIIANGPQQLIIDIYYMYYYLAIFAVLLYYHHKTQEKTQKRKALLLCCAIGIPFISNGIFYLLLPALLHTMNIPTAAIAMTISNALLCLLIIKYGENLYPPQILASTILETMDEGVICIAEAAKIEFVNAEIEKLLQYTKKELLHQPLEKYLFSPNDYQKITQKLILPIRGSTTTIATTEVALRSSTGNKKIVQISAAPINNENQKRTGYILILSDVTSIQQSLESLTEKLEEISQKNINLEELKQTLEKEKQNSEQRIRERTRDLQEEHARLLASINNLGLGFIILDKENKISLINQKAKDIFNLDSSEENSNLESLQNMIGNKQIDLKKEIEKVSTLHKPAQLDDIQIKKKYINIYLTSINITTGEETEVIGSVIILEDNTENKVIQKTKEDFFNIASHELRTPLTAIKGYASLIEQFYFEKLTNEELKRMIKAIDNSCSKLIDIVSDFLDTSRLEQGKIVLQKETCNLEEVVQEAIQEIQPIATEKKLTISLPKPFPHSTIMADKQRLKQVLNNLLSNAIKFTNQGGVAIKVDDTESKFVKIYIKDSGKGISEQNKALLFRKLLQAGDENLYTREEGGTGLGLYISKLLIEKMQGTLQLERSVAGQGTTFSITIPKMT